ncbi:MAG: hypothetical protein RIC03_06810 [Cyclobacteriaceae bacterium]
MIHKPSIIETHWGVEATPAQQADWQKVLFFILGAMGAYLAVGLMLLISPLYILVYPFICYDLYLDQYIWYEDDDLAWYEQSYVAPYIKEMTADEQEHLLEQLKKEYPEPPTSYSPLKVCKR